MERFINCNCEGQSNSQFMDLFPVSKSRGCSHVFRNYYWWQLPPIFSLVFSPLSFSFASCAIQLLLKKRHRLSLWMPAMTSLWCEGSLPKDSGPQSLCYSRVTAHSPPFQPRREIAHISRTAPHFPISHQHTPESCRGTKQDRIWGWSGAACFSLANQEMHTAQSLSETHRTDKYCGHVDLNLGLSLHL